MGGGLLTGVVCHHAWAAQANSAHLDQISTMSLPPQSVSSKTTFLIVGENCGHSKYRDVSALCGGGAHAWAWRCGVAAGQRRDMRRASMRPCPPPPPSPLFRPRSTATLWPLASSLQNCKHRYLPPTGQNAWRHSPLTSDCLQSDLSKSKVTETLTHWAPLTGQEARHQAD